MLTEFGKEITNSLNSLELSCGVRVEVFTSWPDGIDVGVNLLNQQGELVTTLDLTGPETRKLIQLLERKLCESEQVDYALFQELEATEREHILTKRPRDRNEGR